jgi:hypothetical protein
MSKEQQWNDDLLGKTEGTRRENYWIATSFTTIFTRKYQGLHPTVPDFMPMA